MNANTNANTNANGNISSSCVRDCPCSRPVGDAYLCRVCTAALVVLLGSVRGLLYELRVTAARLDHVVSVSSVRAKKQGRLLPLRLEALECAAELSAAAGHWGPLDAYTIAKLPEGPEYHRQLSVAVEAATAIIDLPKELIHLGRCGHVLEDVVCEQELFATADQTSLCCEVCGTVWDIPARRAGKLATAWDVYATPPVIIRALATQGVTVTAKQIQNWAQLGHLDGIADETGRRCYQVAQVYAVAARMLARRRT